MEQKRNTSEQAEQRSNDVGPERFAPTLTEIYIMNQATTQWKGQRCLAYDSYDARVRSFLNWPRYLNPTPTALNTAGFFYSGKTQYFLLILSQYEYIRFSKLFLLLSTGTGAKQSVFIAG